MVGPLKRNCFSLKMRKRRGDRKRKEEEEGEKVEVVVDMVSIISAQQEEILDC